MSEIFVDIENFDDVFEMQQRRESTLSEYNLKPMFNGQHRSTWGTKSGTSSIGSSLSDYGLCNLFNEVPRSEWSHRSNWDQRSQASSIGSDYGLYNLFNRVPRSDWSHRRCSTGSLMSNPDAHPLFAFINPITWPDVRKRSKTPKLSLYA